MGLKMIKAQGGIFGWVANSEALIEALARRVTVSRQYPGAKPAVAPPASS